MYCENLFSLINSRECISLNLCSRAVRDFITDDIESVYNRRSTLSISSLPDSTLFIYNQNITSRNDSWKPYGNCTSLFGQFTFFLETIIVIRLGNLWNLMYVCQPHIHHFPEFLHGFPHNIAWSQSLAHDHIRLIGHFFHNQ